jgi:hypothetical protein
MCHQPGLPGLARAQAEPRAALSLAARGESPILKLSPSDLVLYSAKARFSARLHPPRLTPCALPILVLSPGGMALRSAKACPSPARARPCAAAVRHLCDDRRPARRPAPRRQPVADTPDRSAASLLDLQGLPGVSWSTVDGHGAGYKFRVRRPCSP